MMVEITQHDGDEITLQVKVKLTGSLMDMEESIQRGANALGVSATQEALKKFDTTGVSIQVGDIRMTSKG